MPLANSSAVENALSVVSSGPKLVLRDYQRQAIDAAYEWHTKNQGHCLVVVPTGGGKSLIMGTIAAEAVAGGARVSVIAHRKELINQNWRALLHAGLHSLQCGLISAQHGRKSLHTPATVASIQTLGRNPYQYGPYDLVLVDEAHMIPRNSNTMFRKVLSAFRTRRPSVRIIGFTATPYRLDSGYLHKGDDRLFDDIAYEITIRELLDAGFLAPLISKATLARYDVSKVATRGGEYVEHDLQITVDAPEATSAIVEELAQLGVGRKRWLVFCAGVSHAEHVAEALTAKGFPSASVHAGLSSTERAIRLEAFRSGRLRALTNCDILTTGYDEPSIDLLALCRPTMSAGLHVQMLGRGLRTAQGKTECLVLDFAENIMRHGPVDDVRIREPKRGKSASDSVPAKECPECHLLVATAVRKCPGEECDYTFPPPRPTQLVPSALLTPVMTHEKAPATWVDITTMVCDRHVSRDPAKHDTLRVDYYWHFQRVASEWICIEHEGYARVKAEEWWFHKMGDPCPKTIDEAIELSPGLEVPAAIALEQEGRYERVINRRYKDDPETASEKAEHPAKTTAARACVFCKYWDELSPKTCLKYDAEIPDEIRRVGCEGFEDLDLPF